MKSAAATAPSKLAARQAKLGNLTLDKRGEARPRGRQPGRPGGQEEARRAVRAAAEGHAAGQGDRGHGQGRAGARGAGEDPAARSPLWHGITKAIAHSRRAAASGVSAAGIPGKSATVRQTSLSRYLPPRVAIS